MWSTLLEIFVVSVLGQELNLSQFNKSYTSKSEALIKKYVANKEMQIKRILYNTHDLDGQFIEDSVSKLTFRSLSDGFQVNSTIETVEGPDLFNWARPGNHFFLIDGSSFLVEKSALANWSISKLEFHKSGALTPTGSTLTNVVFCPMICGRSFPLVTNALRAPKSSRFSGLYPYFDKLDYFMENGARRARLSGSRKTITRSSQSRSETNTRCQLVLDPNDNFSVLSFETEDHLPLNSKRPRKERVLVEYKTENGKRIHPLKVTIADIFGKEIVIREIYDFISVKDYTPTEWDFRLEKEFSLPTPGFDPSPLLNPNRNFSWFLILAGIVFLILLGIWFWRANKTRAAKIS
jgi:hypothetical protein